MVKNNGLLKLNKKVVEIMLKNKESTWKFEQKLKKYFKFYKDIILNLTVLLEFDYNFDYKN